MPTRCHDVCSLSLAGGGTRSWICDGPRVRACIRGSDQPETRRKAQRKPGNCGSELATTRSFLLSRTTTCSRRGTWKRRASAGKCGHILIHAMPLRIECFPEWPQTFLGHYEIAISEARRAIELDPDFGIAYYNEAVKARHILAGSSRRRKRWRTRTSAGIQRR